MAERLHLGGITNTVIHTETDGTIHIEERQDCEPILDWTAALRNQRFGAETGEFGQYEGEVPWTVYMAKAKEVLGVDHAGAVRALGTDEGQMVIELIMRDPANANLRAAPKLRDPRVIMKGLR
jgi:hypothetical protein